MCIAVTKLFKLDHLYNSNFDSVRFWKKKKRIKPKNKKTLMNLNISISFDFSDILETIIFI